jgi:hypothetical protein
VEGEAAGSLSIILIIIIIIITTTINRTGIW